MNTVALSKCAISALTISLTYTSLYPPNRAKSGDNVERSTLLNKHVMRITPFMILWLVTPPIIEFLPAIFTFLPDIYPDLDYPDVDSNNPFSILFIIGSSSMIFGSIVRHWCYKTLGKHFTFEVTIRPDHKLITSGPYAFLRHPSYMGFFSICFGATVLLWNPEGALSSCGLTAFTTVQVLQAFWTIALLLLCFTVVKRVGGEDYHLKEHFGKEWEVYAARVRYSLIPFVY